METQTPIEHEIITIVEEMPNTQQLNLKKLVEALTTLVFEDEFNELVKANSIASLQWEKSVSRQTFILEKKAEIENQLVHYTTVKNRWAKRDTTIEIVGTCLFLILSILSPVFFLLELLRRWSLAHFRA